MNQNIYTTSIMNNRTFVKIFLHHSLVGDPDFIGWRLFVSKEREIDCLPFEECYKAYQKQQLKKSKFGIAIDDLGGVCLVNDMRQVVAAKILPTWPALSLRYLQLTDLDEVEE